MGRLYYIEEFGIIIQKVESMCWESEQFDDETNASTLWNIL